MVIEQLQPPKKRTARISLILAGILLPLQVAASVLAIYAGEWTRLIFAAGTFVWCVLWFRAERNADWYRDWSLELREDNDRLRSQLINERYNRVGPVAGSHRRDLQGPS